MVAYNTFKHFFIDRNSGDFYIFVFVAENMLIYASFVYLSKYFCREDT